MLILQHHCYAVEEIVAQCTGMLVDRPIDQGRAADANCKRSHMHTNPAGLYPTVWTIKLRGA